MKLIVPAAIWQAAMTALRQRPHDRERVAYLDGPRPQNDIAVVTTLTIPNADNHQGNFSVSADEMSRAGRHLRHLGLRRHAQIHTHPAGWTGHSQHDDKLAFSQRDGAISIVVAYFAGCAPGLSDCGIHTRDQHGWRELDAAEKTAVVQIVPSLVDLRL